MPEKNLIENWFNSPYYQLISQKNDDAAQLLIDNLLKYLKPETGSIILEVGCGNGTYSKLLSGLGFEVTGIDQSFKMIEEALEIKDDNLQFFQHDIRLPFWINYFDYAFHSFTNFGYFKTRREHDNAIRTIAQALKIGGVFVIDFFNVHYAEDHLEKKVVKKLEDIKFHLTKWHDDDHFYNQIQVEEKGQSVKHLFTEKLAKLSLGDFNDMFAYQGLQIQEVFGDYNLDIYDIKKSPRLIMIAKKIKV